MDTFERWVEINAAYDKRNPDPHKNYGIHGVVLRFYLRGPKGVMQFVISTNWYLPHVRDELLAKTFNADDARIRFLPFPTDIGYHSPIPMWEGQTVMDDECPVLGGPCYYDGSGLDAEKVFTKMVEGGHKAMWSEIERFYNLWLDPQEEETRE